MLASEVYLDLEAQILEQLRDGDLEQLHFLLSEHDLEVELLSGEWRVLFEDLQDDYYQVVDADRRTARMAISPGELEEFVNRLRDDAHRERYRPISFGLAELADALPAGTDLVGVVFTEESDDWMWAEPVNEIVAIRPEVFALLEPHFRRLLDQGDLRALARMAADHAEGSVEFSPEQWKVLMRHSRERVPELITVFESRLSLPIDFTSVREALSLVADPRFQPSLDAWLRVHASSSQYAVYFRDASVERREYEASGLFNLDFMQRNTQRMAAVPLPSGPAPDEDAPEDVPEEATTGKTVPLNLGERHRVVADGGRNKDS
jgi:hypothetical protein